MTWIRRILGELAGRSDEGGDPIASIRDEIRKTETNLAAALSFALRGREPQLKLAEHCTHVALTATELADRMEISEADRYNLEMAARLHELGMLAVPPELLCISRPLTSAELARVRGQAAIGAQILRAVHPPRVAWLVEHQYEDYASLRRRGNISERDLLLAGILRISDVITAVTRPRPYQDPMPPARRTEMLQIGAGHRFHPRAAELAIELQRYA